MIKKAKYGESTMTKIDFTAKNELSEIENLKDFIF